MDNIINKINSLPSWAITAYIVILCIVPIVILTVIFEPWTILSKNSIKGQRYRYKIWRVYKSVTIKIYNLLDRFILTHILVSNIRSMFADMYVLDVEESKVKTVSLFLIELVVGMVSAIISVIYFNDSLLALLMALMIMIYTYYKYRGDGHKFLENLEDTVSDMVHMYNASNNNIDKMFELVLADKSIYVYKHIEQMYVYLRRAILDTSDKSAIIEYNELAASRHLRLIFNYLYITYRYGDEKNIVGEQMFNRNMLAIQREIHADLVKLQSIKDRTIGEQWFIILALAMIPAAEWYMNTFFTFDGFETIGRLLNSSIGYLIKMVCAIVSVVTYIIYMRLMDANAALEFHKEVIWEEMLLKNSNKLKRFLDKLAPKVGTKEREKLETDIQFTEGYNGVRPFYLRKVIYAVVATVITVTLLSVDTYGSYMSIVNDIYVGVNKSYMDQVISLENYPETYKVNSISNDILVIDLINNNIDEYNSLGSRDEKVSYIESLILNNNIDYGLYYEVAAERVFEKYTQINNINPNIVYLVGVLVFFGAYMIPNLSLKLKLLLNKGAIIYDEVNGCYTVVVLLINHSASNVYMMFTWLVSFAKVFKGRLQACLDNLNEKEIKELCVGVNYKPLSRLIDCMLLAYNGVDLKSAFAGIEQTHIFQEETRRLLNEQVINRRVAFSEALSWLAMGVTFTLYIMAPMLYAILDMLRQVW